MGSSLSLVVEHDGPLLPSGPRGSQEEVTTTTPSLKISRSPLFLEPRNEPEDIVVSTISWSNVRVCVQSDPRGESESTHLDIEKDITNRSHLHNNRVSKDRIILRRKEQETDLSLLKRTPK